MTTEPTKQATKLPSGPQSGLRKVLDWMGDALKSATETPASQRDNAEVFKWVKRALDDAGSDNRMPMELRIGAYRASHLIKDAELDGPKLPKGDDTKQQVESIVRVLQDLGQHHAAHRDDFSMSYVSRIRRDLAAHAGVKPFYGLRQKYERPILGM